MFEDLLTVNDLQQRANRSGFKDAMPKKPMLNSKVRNPEAHLRSRMAGYKKRLRNWYTKLVQAEDTKPSIVDTLVAK